MKNISPIIYYLFLNTVSSLVLKDIDIHSLTSEQGTFVRGLTSSSNFGNSVNSAGDVNGDGINDIIIGAYTAATAYVVYGSKTGLDNLDSVTISSLHTTNQ